MANTRNTNALLRIITGLILLTGAGAAFTGCSDALEPPAGAVSGPEAGYITLTLKSGLHTTRATEPGIDELNENLIKTVTLCLSPSAGDRTDDDPPVYMQTFEDLDADGEVTLRVPITTELATRLFNENGDSECRVFAAVNVNPGDAKTVSALRRMTVGSTFGSRKEQASFAMDGDSKVTYSQAGNYATGEVTVKRSAAKVTLALYVDDNVTETVNGEEIVWRPDMEGMRVRLQQGVMTSTLDPRPGTDGIPDENYFNTPDNLAYEFTHKEQEDPYGEYVWEQRVPFYTYPNKWTDSVDERHATFMILSVPWTSDGGATWVTSYYHVPVVPFDQFETVRNNSYHVYLHVGLLGSFVPEEPFEVEADYYVADWGSESMDVDIKDYRYLVVDQNDYVVNNQESTSIQFYTSHETVVTDVKMTFYRYNFSDQGSEFGVDVSMDQNTRSAEVGGEPVYECYFDNTHSALRLSHALNIWTPYNAENLEVALTHGLQTGAISNVRDSDGRYFVDITPASRNALDAVLNSISYFKQSNELEFSRIRYEITVQHKDVADGSSGIDKNLYKETVTIMQYPGMYITAVQNYCDNLQNQQSTNAISGNTYVNGNCTDGDTYKFTQGSDFVTTVAGTDRNTQIIRQIYNYRNWDRSIGLGFPPVYYNWNPNLYLVTITQLSEDLGDKYVISDPRSYNINNDLSNDNGSYTVDGGSQDVFKTEYWYFTSRANGYRFTQSSTRLNSPTINGYPSAFEYVLYGFTTAPALGESGTRTLKYYYPTREGENNKYTIAPKFRICSSYAGSSGYLTREMSRRRAAAYQEIGYPAGRWRLPTFGEVEYIMLLAAQQKIPRLFGTTDAGTWYYWCAQGAVAVPDSKAADQQVSVVPPPTSASSPTCIYTLPFAPFSGNNFLGRTRFVYDEWYWGDETLTPSSGSPSTTNTIYRFTWGDKPKSNPQD